MTDTLNKSADGVPYTLDNMKQDHRGWFGWFTFTMPDGKPKRAGAVSILTNKAEAREDLHRVAREFVALPP